MREEEPFPETVPDGADAPEVTVATADVVEETVIEPMPDTQSENQLGRPSFAGSSYVDLYIYIHT